MSQPSHQSNLGGVGGDAAEDRGVRNDHIPPMNPATAHSAANPMNTIPAASFMRSV